METGWVLEPFASEITKEIARALANSFGLTPDGNRDDIPTIPAIWSFRLPLIGNRSK